jgi:UDP-glucose 4-epimerase
MNPKKTVLITGVAGYWGSRVAQKLLAEGSWEVAGLDEEALAEEVPGLDFVQADIRNPLLVDLLKAKHVDTVCHLAFIDTQRLGEAAFDLNVMGTAKLMGACTAAGVRKIVLKSSMAVYGARATNSAFLSEDQPLRGSRRYGYLRDMVEIEAFCADLRHREPDLLLTIVRFSSIVGPTADTPMTRFLQEPWAPSLLGFDPMMQLVHEEDVIHALVHAVCQDLPGVYNIAAEGVLPLSKMRALSGKPPIPVFHKLADWGVALPGGASRLLERLLPIEPNYIRFPWVGDLTRMHKEFGFVPSHTSDEILIEFAQRFNPGRGRARSARAPSSAGTRPHASEQSGLAGNGKPPTASAVGEGDAGV